MSDVSLPRPWGWLAAALFLRLHGATGDAAWRAWADRTLDWLDATLWDDDAGLYRWGVHYADRPTASGQAVTRGWSEGGRAPLRAP